MASRCVFVEAGVGAVATQNLTDPRLGQLGLDLLRRGYAAKPVVEELVRSGAYPEHRQLACVDSDGRSAVWTGAEALGIHATLTADDVAVAGNLLSSRRVVEAMAEAFLSKPNDHLADRLVSALRAGREAGGEAGHDERSAGLTVCDREAFPIVDLRVDWDEVDPAAALRGLWTRFAPEVGTFVDRAKNPAVAAPFQAPS